MLNSFRVEFSVRCEVDVAGRMAVPEDVRPIPGTWEHPLYIAKETGGVMKVSALEVACRRLPGASAHPWVPKGRHSLSSDQRGECGRGWAHHWL